MSTSNQTEWWSEEAGFFGPRYLEEYEAITPAERTEKEVRFLMENVLFDTGPRILDMPCGAGRHSIAIAKQGRVVTGVDVNSHHLSVAREAAKQAGVEATFRHGDMRTCVLPPEEFHAVVNLFTSLGYFDDDADDARVMEQAFHTLKPGGLFVVDFINQARILNQFKEESVGELADGSVVIEQRTYSVRSGILTDTRRRLGGEHVYPTITTTLRLYSATELAQMGEAVGFTVYDSFGSFTGAPLSLDSPRCILVFRKPA